MHLMLFNFILLLLLPNPTLQSRVTFATSRQISPSQHWAAQTCNNVGVTNCCAPLNLNVPGVGHGWFRASYIQFSNLPPVSLYLSVWRAQGTGYSCKGATAGDETADGGTDIEYSDTSAVGLGGAWYTEWVSNKTVVAASPEVLHPDQVFYQGEIYMEQNKGMGIFYGPNGKLIFGLPFSTSNSRSSG